MCDLGISVGGAIGLGLGIDEILIHSGREPVFKNTVGGKFDELLTKYGYKKPNNDINNYKDSIDILNKKINKYNTLLKELNDLNGINMNEEDKEFFNKIKEELVRDFYKNNQTLKNLLEENIKENDLKIIDGSESNIDEKRIEDLKRIVGSSQNK